MWEPGDGWKHRCLTTSRTSRFWTRPEYFPVFFVTPLESNEKAVGFGLASNAVRLAALCEAADTGEVCLTARIKLVQDEESQNAFLAFALVYRGSPGTVEERRAALCGFAFGVYRIKDIFITSILSGNGSGIEMTLLDETEPDLVLVGGILLTLVVVAYLGNLERRTFVVRELVKQRTQKLSRCEESSRAIVMTAAEGVITIDEVGIISSFNPVTERMFGYTTSGVVGKNASMLMPKSYSKEQDSYIQNYLRTGVGKIIEIGREIVGRRRDGSEFPPNCRSARSIWATHGYSRGSCAIFPSKNALKKSCVSQRPWTH